nr:MAG TPA: hypothetical protein [Caudoviricetes sp.]
MREAFERWAVVEGLPVNKGSKKEYLNVKTRLAWRAWKAGVQYKSRADEVLLSRSYKNQTHEALKCDSPKSDVSILDMLSTYSER